MERSFWTTGAVNVMSRPRPLAFVHLKMGKEMMDFLRANPEGCEVQTDDTGSK